MGRVGGEPCLTRNGCCEDGDGPAALCKKRFWEAPGAKAEQPSTRQESGAIINAMYFMMIRYEKLLLFMSVVYQSAMT